MKHTEIYPQYIELEGELSNSFNAEVHTSLGCYYLECHVTATYCKEEEDLGISRSVDNSIIEISAGHFENEAGYIRQLNTKLEEELEYKLNQNIQIL